MTTNDIRISIILGILILLNGCSNPTDTRSDPETEAPAAPTNLKVESKDEAIDLSWDTNVESDFVGYNLYRSESSFSDVSGMKPVNGHSPIVNSKFTDSGLQNGTTYYYRLTAVDDSFNESEASVQKKVTPFPNPPDQP